MISLHLLDSRPIGGAHPTIGVEVTWIAAIRIAVIAILGILERRKAKLM